MGYAVTGLERQFQGSVFLRCGRREDFANPVGDDLEAVIAGNGQHPLAPPTGQIRHDDFNIADEVDFSLLLLVAILKTVPDMEDDHGFIVHTIPRDIAALAERDE
jgi:hypothetical protein